MPSQPGGALQLQWIQRECGHAIHVNREARHIDATGSPGAGALVCLERGHPAGNAVCQHPDVRPTPHMAQIAITSVQQVDCGTTRRSTLRAASAGARACFPAAAAAASGRRAAGRAAAEQLPPHERGKRATGRDQVTVSAALRDLAVLNDHDLIGGLHCRQAVRDDDDGPAACGCVWLGRVPLGARAWAGVRLTDERWCAWAALHVQEAPAGAPLSVQKQATATQHATTLRPSQGQVSVCE